MERYLQSLGQTDLINSEWLAIRDSKYKFNPSYNYYTEVEQYALAENKLLTNKYSEADVKDCLRERMFEARKHVKCHCHKMPWECECNVPYTEDEIKERVYKEWLSYKYKQFKKDWKPKDDVGLNYMWITLNYSPTMPINEMLLETARIVNLPILARSKRTYCFEMHTEEGAHPHVHMLVELKRTGTVAMSAFLDDVYKKKVLKEKLKVDFKFSWAKQYEKRCQKRDVLIAYLNGEKIDKKVSNSIQDKLWRQENNLEDLYIKDND